MFENKKKSAKTKAHALASPNNTNEGGASAKATSARMNGIEEEVPRLEHIDAAQGPGIEHLLIP